MLFNGMIRVVCVAVGLSCCHKFNQLSLTHDVRLDATAAQCHHHTGETTTRHKKEKKTLTIDDNREEDRNALDFVCTLK